MALVFRFPRSSFVLPSSVCLEREVVPFWRNSGDNLNLGNTFSQIVNDNEKFAISLDVSQFKPEELKVNLDGRIFTVEAKNERNDENNYIQRSFTRKWTLPEDVDLSSLHSKISDEGHLSIEASKTSVTRTIPIQRM